MKPNVRMVTTVTTLKNLLVKPLVGTKLDIESTATAAEKTLLSTIPTALVTKGATAAANSAAESTDERVDVPSALM